MKDESLQFTFSQECLSVFEKYYEKVSDIRSLCNDYEINKVKNQATIIKNFIITCIITCIITLGIFLCFVVPSISHLGITSILISSHSLILLFMILSLGAGIVFFYVSKKKDIFLEKPNSLFMDRVIIETTLLGYFFSNQKHKVFSCILDLSTLNRNGSGICLAYYDVRHRTNKCEKKESKIFHFDKKISLKFTSVLAILVLPFITIFSIIYNSLRIVFLPFYILFCLAKKNIINSENNKCEPHFEIADIFLETIFSLKRIVQAPFYSTALFFSLVYSLVSVKNGRIIVGILERNWNENVYISSGFQQLYAHKYWQWEGGCRPKHLGKNGYYLMGCVQPRDVFFIKNWQIIQGRRMFNTVLSENFLENKENTINIIKSCKR